MMRWNQHVQACRPIHGMVSEPDSGHQHHGLCMEPQRPGVSLLEVLTALAIFFLALVGISQMVDQASRTGQTVAYMTKASIYAESRLAELSAGVLPLETTGLEPIAEAEPGWFIIVVCQPESWTQVATSSGGLFGLTVVEVTVIRQTPSGNVEMEFSLSRVIMDPRLRIPDPNASTTNANGM